VPPSDTRNVGLFLFEELPAGSLTWQAGLRLENQRIDVDAGLPDYDDTSINASAALVWDFAAAHSLALNVTRAERHPAATELYADGPHLAVRRFEVGDPDLDPETALTADLTLRRTAGDLRFAATAFVNRFSDFIYAAGTGVIADDLPVYEYRQQDADFFGFEGEIELALGALAGGGVTGRLLADYVRGRFRDGAGDVPLLPPLRFGGELAWERNRLAATLSVLRNDDQDEVAANELPTDGFTDVGLDLSYRVPLDAGRLLAFVRGTNLLDEDARRSTSPLKEFAPLPGLNLAAGVRLEF
jgi:iron complex outermembrane receptor protein